MKEIILHGVTKENEKRFADFIISTKEEKEIFDRKIYELWNGEIIDDNDEMSFKNYMQNLENFKT